MSFLMMSGSIASLCLSFTGNSARTQVTLSGRAGEPLTATLQLQGLGLTGLSSWRIEHFCTKKPKERLLPDSLRALWVQKLKETCEFDH